MAKFELIMPKMGESIAEATIIKWLKEEGDSIEQDEAVLEIATDKVDSEVPSPKAGVLSKMFFNEGDVVEVGKAIAMLEIQGEKDDNIPTKAEEITEIEEAAEEISESVSAIKESVQSKINQENIIPISNSSNRFYSPLVMNIVRTEGISMQELENINGSGNEGRVTKRDIINYLENRTTAQPDSKSTAPKTSQALETSLNNASAVQNSDNKPAKKEINISINPGDEIIEMDRMRKLIADHMVMSKQTSPHVTSMVEADVTNLVLWRNKHKKTFEQKEGEKLTFTPLIMEAIIKAIKDFPMINISVNGDKIIKRKAINLGMAAARPDGNLIVPVIKNAADYNLSGLAKKVNDLANRARNNELKPEEIQGGTYTLTNVGTFGNVFGTPIINQPQVAIMAVGAIRKKPAVLETEQGDVIAIRHMMYLSHSYDHRIVDGALGGMFVRRVGDYLEQWDLDREI